MSPVITIACIIGILLGAGLILFAVVSRKKVPAFFAVIMMAVGFLSILSSVLILLGTRMAA